VYIPQLYLYWLTATPGRIFHSASVGSGSPFPICFLPNWQKLSHHSGNPHYVGPCQLEEAGCRNFYPFITRRGVFGLKLKTPQPSFSATVRYPVSTANFLNSPTVLHISLKKITHHISWTAYPFTWISELSPKISPYWNILHWPKRNSIPVTDPGSTRASLLTDWGSAFAGAWAGRCHS